MKFKIRCKSLQEVERHSNQVRCEGVATERMREEHRVFVIVAGFQHANQDFDAYMSFDIKLIGDDIKVGDEYEFELRKV